MSDWREPEHRREAFQRFYSFHLKYKTHPGCVYFMLPALAEHYDLDDDGKAWLVWLNGNTQNPVTTQLLLEASGGDPDRWEDSVRFWNDNWDRLQWDTDRRYQKGKFGEATAAWIDGAGQAPAFGWKFAGHQGWDATWMFANGQPYMGRLSAWSMTEYAKIMFPDDVPDASTLLLRDSGSTSHRNGLSIIAGWGNPYLKWDKHDLDLWVPELEQLGEALLTEAAGRNLVGAPECECLPPYDSCTHEPEPHPDVLRLTLESALCTYKSWHKPNRRYPNVYADMHHDRIRWAEERWGARFQLQWDARAEHLPEYLRLEATPGDPGLVPAKQNHYLETGEIPMLHREWPDMDNEFNKRIEGR